MRRSLFLQPTSTDSATRFPSIATATRVFFLNPSTGAVVRSIDPQNNDTVGSMTWDGTAVRVANVTTGAGFINAINSGNGMQVGSMPVPPGKGEGMTFDGRHIFYSTENRIHQVHPSTGAVARSFPVLGGGSCHALASDGRNLLFAGDASRNEIIVFEKRSLRVVSRTLPFQPRQDPITARWGLGSSPACPNAAR